MENKFSNLLSNTFIMKLLVCSNIIDFEKTTKDEAIKIFLELDEKNKYYRILSSLAINKKLNEAIKRISKDLDLTFENKSYNINLFKPMLRSFLSEDVNESEKMIEDTVTLIEDKKKEQRTLKPLSFSDFMKTIEKKKYYVKNMFAAGTINMIFSPPKQMKSFVSYYLALCMATGNDFLEQKTKKSNVCYFDWENPMSDVQNRIKGICKGMKFDMTKIDNLFFFPRQTTLIKVEKFDSFVYDDVREELLNFIKDNDIKIIFFDTFRRLGNFDENDSRTINTIKSELFDPLINKTGVCIIFLHHTSKEGKTYRGSVDIEGIVDTSFKITKKEGEDDILLKVTCDARRNNEIDCIKANVEIENISKEDEDGEMYEEIQTVKFKRIEINEIEEVANDYKQYRAKMVENLVIDEKYRNKDLKEILQAEFDIKSDRTISNILKWMVNVDILIKTGSHKTTRYEINQEIKNDIGVVKEESR